MKKSSKNFIIAVIIGVLANLISSIIVALVQNVNIIQAIKIVIAWITESIIYIINIKISLWIIIIIISSAIIIDKIIKNVFNNKIDSNSEIKKIYRDYTEDIYKGIHYKWKWFETYDGQVLDKIHPICECGCNLNFNNWALERYIVCPDCNKKYDTNDISEEDAGNVFANRCNKKIKEFVKSIKK